MGKQIRDILLEKAIQPDFSYESNRPEALIDYIHRKTDEADIYYVVNRNERPEYLNVSFRIDAKTPELWNPIKGEITDYPVYNIENGITSMPLFLEPFGSALIVFKKETKSHYTQISLNNESLFPGLPEDTFNTSPFIPQSEGKVLLVETGKYMLTSSTGETKSISVGEIPEIKINPPWEVSFNLQWGGPENIIFNDLALWNNHRDPGIRYYSGTAVYNNTFEITSGQSQNKQVFLDLGEMYNLAEVYVNGQSAGVWWQPPFTGDITHLVKDGKNQLEVKVVNLWPNRLIGDKYLPENERYTKTNVAKFDKDYPLRPSGLAGPVVVKIIEN